MPHGTFTLTSYLRCTKTKTYFVKASAPFDPPPPPKTIDFELVNKRLGATCAHSPRAPHQTPIVDLLRILNRRKWKDLPGGAVVVPPGKKRVVRWSTKGRSAAAAVLPRMLPGCGADGNCVRRLERRGQEPRAVTVHAQYDCHPKCVT